ncbi:hypothetical protein FQA39_LY01965 [Lamprigera yunnana]|nr:hypothetical protein FQA39_LY01965 [Lamprigera yunnana]
MLATVFQIIAVVTATLSVLSDGMHFGWTSPVGPILLSPDSPVKADESDIILLEILYMIGGIFGLPINMYLLDKIGRKRTILVGTVEGLIGWIMIASSSSIKVLLAARLIAGLAGDVAFMAAPVYVAEISDRKIRGHLEILIFIMLMMGILLMYILGPDVPIPVSSTVGACILVLQLLTFSFMPESPYWLLMKNQKEMAEKSLKIFRCSQNVEDELDQMTHTVQNELGERKNFLDLFKVRSNLKAAMIMTVLNVGQHFSGLTAISMNIHFILNDAGGNISTYTAAVLYSVMMLVGSLVACVLVDLIGRKILLCVSTSLTAVSLFTLGIYFTLKNNDVNISSFNWIPPITVLLYAFTFQSGLGSVPNVLTAELFPTNIKAAGVAYADAVFIISGILSVNVFQLLQRFGMQAPFFLFSCCCALTCLFVLLVVPETKGITLSEIQYLLKGNEIPNFSNINTIEVSAKIQPISNTLQENIGITPIQ